MVRHQKNMGKYAKYSDEQKKSVLRMIRIDGKSHRQVSRQLNIPKSTINRWCENPGMIFFQGIFT